MELEQNIKDFEKLGLKVSGLSYDTPAVLKNFADRKGIHFPLLSDPESKIIREIGILNEDVPKSSPFFGIPHPGVYLLDAKGVVTAKYFEEDFKERTTGADILVQHFGILPDSRKSEVQGKQLDATTSASNRIVRPGQKVALVLDLQLKPNMHVYAPGVDGYIPIDWKIKESDLAVAHNTAYPKPEILFLKAIDEKVPVYKGHLRLVRDVTIGPDGKVKGALDSNGTFTVEGSLRYQACDDRMCYIPQELPLKWTFQYEAFDRQRVPAELQRKVN